MIKHDGMEESEYQCDICWYHYASSEETLDSHKRKKRNTEPFLCKWPSCRAIMPDQKALDAHYRYTHKRQTYFCPVRACHQQFVIEAEWQDHVAAQHSQDPEVGGATPQILPSQYRLFDVEEMRFLCESAIATWKKDCESEGGRWLRITMSARRL